MRWILLIFSLLITGCNTSMKHYEQQGQQLEFDRFFNGNLTAYGIVQNRRGQVIRRFRADLYGKWSENSGTLDEYFYFDDGEHQHRQWQLHKHNDVSFSGYSTDSTGPARGRSHGFALKWNYNLSILVDGKSWNIKFDDWMFQLDERRLINRVKMSKWGIRVGEVTLWIEKNQTHSKGFESTNRQ